MEVWKWYLLTSSESVTDKQLTNGVTFIKTIILEHASAATHVVIYDEATGNTTKEFMTIRNSTAKLTVPIVLDEPAQLENGCYIVPKANTYGTKVWIQYKVI